MFVDSIVMVIVVIVIVVVCVVKDSEVFVRVGYCFNKGEIISDSDECLLFVGWNIMLIEN